MAPPSFAASVVVDLGWPEVNGADDDVASTDPYISKDYDTTDQIGWMDWWLVPESEKKNEAAMKRRTDNERAERWVVFVVLKGDQKEKKNKRMKGDTQLLRKLKPPPFPNFKKNSPRFQKQPRVRIGLGEMCERSVAEAQKKGNKRG